jgi:hypothetical protein
MDSTALFHRLMAEATAALEDAATCAADLQDPAMPDAERERRLGHGQRLALDAIALFRTGQRIRG